MDVIDNIQNFMDEEEAEVEDLFWEQNQELLEAHNDEGEPDDFSIDENIDLPNEAPTGSTNELSSDNRRSCHFFAKGNCKNGDDCKFKHDGNALESFKNRDPNLRTYKGTKVQFADGADVIEVQLPYEQYTAPKIGDGLGLATETVPETAVICAWYKPSKQAIIHYARDKKADARWAERRLRDEVIKGKKIKVHYLDKKFSKSVMTGKKEHRKNYYKNVVCISQLEMSTTKQDIDDILGPRHKYASLQFKRPVDTLEDNKPTHLRLQDLLVRLGLGRNGLLQDDIMTFKELPDVDPLMTRVLVEFHDVADAQRLVLKGHIRMDNNDRQLQYADALRLRKEFPGGIFIFPRCSVKFKVVPNILLAIQPLIHELTSTFWKTGVNIRTYPQSHPPEKFQKVSIYGQDETAVMKAKGAFQALLEGSPAKNGDVILWDDFFSTVDGLKYLQQLYSKKQFYIFRDMRRRRLTLYGSEAKKVSMQEQLIEKTKDLQAYTHVMKLNKENFKAARGGAFQEIVDNFGKDAVLLNAAETPKTLTVYGTEQDFKDARKILKTHVGLYDDDEDGDELCPICFGEPDPENSFTTPCGHTYCRDDLLRLCENKDGMHPIMCFGNEGKCSTILTLGTLRDALPSQEFERILNYSFQEHLKAHNPPFKPCPTPDCAAFFRKTADKDARVVKCHNCWCEICTACIATAHRPLVCEVARNLAQGGELALEEALRHGGMKRCPNLDCQIPVDLVDGCNQVECTVCKTNWCWVCMKICKDFATTHEHMRREHGGYFTGREDQEILIPEGLHMADLAVQGHLP